MIQLGPSNTAPFLNIDPRESSGLSVYGPNSGLSYTDGSSVSSSGNTGGSVLGTTTTPFSAPAPTPVDPFAAFGGKAAYDGLVAGFDAEKNALFNSANTAGDGASIGQRTSIMDFMNDYGRGQRGIDQSRVNANTAKQQGSNSIRDMVGQGINSGNMMLSNRNAGNSSGADAIARAYAQLGNQQMANVGNQFEQSQSAADMQQMELGNDVTNFQRKFEDNKQASINQITQEVNTLLDGLDARMATANLPERIALDQEKGRIKAEAIAKLSQQDQLLGQERAKINPISREEQARQANIDVNAGRDLGADAFNFSTDVPAQFQGTGGFSSGLPIFTAPRKREG